MADSTAIEFQNIETGAGLFAITDEANGYDRLGDPTGWVLFVDVQGSRLTANELRDLADRMDATARASARTARHDVEAAS